MNRKTIAITAAILGLTSASFVAVAASPAKTIETREANFKVMGKAMKGMFDQFKTPAPDMAVIKASAAALSQAAPKVAGHFPKGSGPESGVKTHALPAIWEKPADFKAAAAKLQASVKTLQAAAQGGNLDQIKAAAGGVGGACKGCHEQFKARD